MSLQSLRGGCTLPTLKSHRINTRQQVSRTTVCGAHTVTLLLPNGKTAQFKADSAHSLYDYAKYAGIGLPACCLQGSCTSCVSKIIKGKVDQHKQCCLNAAMTKQGYVALCCAVPLSDVTIQTHQGAAARKLKKELAESK